MKNGMNAKEVLANVVAMIAEGEEYNAENRRNRRFRIYSVCNELSIFDWWNEYLSVSQLKQMRKFLETAITMGYAGYVCFKVGAAGCSNGMWAQSMNPRTGTARTVSACITASSAGRTIGTSNLRMEHGYMTGTADATTVCGK